MEKVDVLVIGAGVAGLTAAALLADAGKKVLVLERSKFLGGRAGGLIHKGHVLDNGGHTPEFMGKGHGFMEDIFEKLGKPYPLPDEIYGSLEIFNNGKWENSMKVLDHRELRKIIDEIMDIPEAELDDYNQVILEDWIGARTQNQAIHDYFWCFAAGGMMANRYDRFPCGEMFRFIREHLKKIGKLAGFWGVFEGGAKVVPDYLSEAIKERGGEIRTNVQVTGIIIENGKACGVEVAPEPSLKLHNNHYLPDQVITSPVVICTVPVWDMVNLLDPRDIPAHYAEWLKTIQYKYRTNFCISCGLKQPLDSWQDIWLMKWAKGYDSKTGIQFICNYWAGYAPEGEYQIDFFWFGDYDESPLLHDLHKVENRRKLKEFWALCEEDLKVFFPDLDKYLLWKEYFYERPGMNFLPGYHCGYPAADMQIPGIQNLYFAGDTLTQSRGVGMQTSAHIALEVVEKILGTKLF